MDYWIHLFSLFSIFGIVALSQGLMVGYTGIVFAGAAGFMGIGAYISAILSLEAGWPIGLSLLAAVLATAASGCILCLLFSKLRKDYLALSTLGAGVILHDIYNNWISLTRGPMGIPGVPELADGNWRALAFFGTSLILSSLAFTVLAHTRFGILLRAIRDDEELALSFGQPALVARILVYLISFALLGLAGAYFAHYILYIDPTSFTLGESITILSMIIIGGMESSSGALIGTAVFIFLPEGLRFLGLPPPLAFQIRQGLFGLALILLMLFRPQGLLGRYRIT